MPVSLTGFTVTIDLLSTIHQEPEAIFLVERMKLSEISFTSNSEYYGSLSAFFSYRIFKTTERYQYTWLYKGNKCR